MIPPYTVADATWRLFFTRWNEEHDAERAEPGLDYEVDPTYCVHPSILVFPERKGCGSEYMKLRSTWILLRRIHAFVPCPENTPMPNKKMTLEARSKIFSVYLRPWTLESDEATVHVPLLTDLNKTNAQWVGGRQSERRKG